VCSEVNVLCIYLKIKRSTLDVKSKPCIFVGYGHDKFGSRCYDPIVKKLIHNRDVIFFEDQTIEDICKVKKSNSSIDDHLIDLDSALMIKEVSQGNILTQEEKQHDQDVDREQITVNNELDLNHDVITPKRS
jgi:hypothetical protein